MDNDYLMHHGVKGQKWGVRNYQNKDGSYKSGAKGRYSSEENTARKSYSVDRYTDSNGNRTDRGKSLKNKVLKAQQYTLRGDDGTVIKRKERNAIAKDMKQTNKEQYKEYVTAKRDADRLRKTIKTSKRTDPDFMVAHGVVDYMVKNQKMKRIKDLQAYERESYLKAVDRVNDILASHGNEMLSRKG